MATTQSLMKGINKMQSKNLINTRGIFQYNTMKFIIKPIVICVLLLTYNISNVCSSFKGHLDDMDGINKYHFSGNTRTRLNHSYRSGDDLYGAALQNKRNTFNNTRNQLIRDWERHTKEKWPTYTEYTRCQVNGTCIYRRVGDLFDAHHIIPLSYK